GRSASGPRGREAGGGRCARAPGGGRRAAEAGGAMPRLSKTFEELRRIGAEAEVSRGSLLWRQGDAGDEVVVLLEGLFDIVRESPEGDPVVIRTVDAGAILGEMAAMDGLARSAAVRASTACRVLRVP